MAFVYRVSFDNKQGRSWVRIEEYYSDHDYARECFRNLASLSKVEKSGYRNVVFSTHVVSERKLNG